MTIHLAAQAGETAEAGRIQAVFRGSLREFGQRPGRAADFKEDSDAGMLAAFCISLSGGITPFQGSQRL